MAGARAPGNGLRRGSMQTGVRQSAGPCRILQGQGCTDPGLGAGSCRILKGSPRGSTTELVCPSN
eukprot:8104804-Pyramimonas_sp.AAC.1